MLIAWLITKMVQASTRVASESWGVKARKKAIRPTTMQNQTSRLSRLAIANRRGERSEAKPLRTDAAKLSTNFPTEAGNRLAIRSIIARVGWAWLTARNATTAIITEMAASTTTPHQSQKLSDPAPDTAAAPTAITSSASTS